MNLLMKRSLSVLMALVLVFAMVPTAFAGDVAESAEGEKAGPGSETEATVHRDAAGENKGEAKDSRNHRDDVVQTADQPELTVKSGVSYHDIDGEPYYAVSVHASVPCEESVTGRFEMYLDGEEPVELDWEDGVNGLVANGTFQVEKPGEHKLLVKFQGDVDGETVTLKEEQAVQFPGEDFRLEVTDDGKGTFGGKLSGVKEAEGRWTIRVFDPNEEEGLVEEHESDATTALEYSHAFEGLKPGTYDVRVSYEGTLDGVKVTASGSLTGVKVGGDGSGAVKDPGKEKPPVKENPADQGGKVENPKGGKLPETSTPYPNFSLLGALVLSVGLALLRTRSAGES